MSFRFVAHSFVMLFVTALGLVGCNRSPDHASSQTVESGNTTFESSHRHGKEAEEHSHTADAEITEQLAKLPPEDRMAAERQKICPVTEQPLGSMGVPPKVTVNGREVFLCCIGCDDALKEAPEEHLAKLPR